MKKIIPYKHPDPWKDAIARAGKDPERLHRLAWLLAEEVAWHRREWQRLGLTPPGQNTPRDVV